MLPRPQAKLGEAPGGISCTPGASAAMQGARQRGACSSVGSERGRALARAPLSSFRLRATGSAMAMRRFPPCPGPSRCRGRLAARPGRGQAPRAALDEVGRNQHPSWRGWTGSSGRAGPISSTTEPPGLGESLVPAQPGLPGEPRGVGRGWREHPTGLRAEQPPPAMVSEEPRAGGEAAELPARLVFSPSRHARQKRLTKTRGVNKNGWRTEPDLHRQEGWRRTG